MQSPPTVGVCSIIRDIFSSFGVITKLLDVPKIGSEEICRKEKAADWLLSLQWKSRAGHSRPGLTFATIIQICIRYR